MKNSAILSFFIFLFLLSSCKDEPIDGPVNIDVEDEFSVHLWEALDGNDRKFHLNIETILAKSCENAEIEYTQYNQQEGIFVTVSDIINDHCTQGTFSAKANIPVGNLAVKEHDLDINLKNVIPNVGKLIVTNDYYEIKIDELNGIVIPNNKLYKVPENTIWGYVAYDDATGEIPNDNFMDELNNMTSPFTATSGYYGYFEIEQNSSVQVFNDLSKVHVKPFVFKYSGPISQLEDLRDTYDSSNFPGVDFKIYLSTGEEI